MSSQTLPRTDFVSNDFDACKHAKWRGVCAVPATFYCYCCQVTEISALVSSVAYLFVDHLDYISLYNPLKQAGKCLLAWHKKRYSMEATWRPLTDSSHMNGPLYSFIHDVRISEYDGGGELELFLIVCFAKLLPYKYV
jgi:hypothetical protein